MTISIWADRQITIDHMTGKESIEREAGAALRKRTEKPGTRKKSPRRKSVLRRGLRVSARTTSYLMPIFLRMALGIASLWTKMFIVLYLTKVFDAYHTPLYLPDMPHEFLTMKYSLPFWSFARP